MKLRHFVIAGFTLLLLGAGGVAIAVQKALAPANPSAAFELFSVERGTPLGRIARNLENGGFVKNARTVVWLAEYRDIAARLKAGEYRISAALSPMEILERIAAGQVETYPVVLPEGLTAAQIGERIEAAGLVDAEEFARVVDDPATAASLGVEGDSLEGYLFPETYRFPRDLPPLEIARAMVSEFQNVWLQVEPQAVEQDMSMLEVVTLGSIVEKETGAADERPLIASVFRNRLKRGMRLETDPTVIYGIPDFDGNLRRRDLENANNPYNTYRIRGLPPGPISNPGAEALRAVVNPADSNFLYFVSRNDGTHKFSATYKEHIVAVNTFQRRR